ncbi:MAG: cold shock domain-containing protein [Planctomycetota bacterium]
MVTGHSVNQQTEPRIDDIEGEVKWFDPRKGFGFIVGPDGQDIFAHYTVIEGEGFRVLRDGCKVRYSAEQTERGWKATQVVLLAEGEVEVVINRRNYARSPRQ